MNFNPNRLIILFICSFLFFISSCKPEEKYIKYEGMIWNTLYHITYKGARNLQDSILPVLKDVEKSLSVFDKNSLVSKLNDSDSIQADDHLARVFKTSILINQLSKGAFDPTISPLIDAWGFGLGHTPTNDTTNIDSILQFVGITKTYIQDRYIKKEDPRISFNFSAIAKGYGCDAVGAMFQRNGVEDYMVEIGGEISIKGKSPTNNNWKIAIDSPVEGKAPGEITSMILSLTDCGIATSGNYRNFREIGGVRTAHTISPQTGRPVTGKILSATIIAEDCMYADGIATACMASSDPISVVSESGTEAFLIFPDSIWMSPGFQRFIYKD